MKITCAGVGYVGLVIGVCLASKGHEVTFYDVDPQKINMLKNKQLPIYEEGLQELLDEYFHRMSFTSKPSEAYSSSDVIMIAVGTPEKKDGSANLTYVYSVVSDIAEHVNQDCVVVVKSTVPVGTNEKIERALLQEFQISNTNKPDIMLEVVSNPEFLAQGTAVENTLNPSRIVIGSETEWAKNVIDKVYADFKCPKVYTDRQSAEMIKYASNVFLSVKISFINEIANLCEKMGANVEDVAMGMGLDNRIGNQFLRAGIGYGGSCFPKDTKALHWLSQYQNCELKTVKAAIEVNQTQRFRPMQLLSAVYGELSGLSVAVLGLSFKPGTDDVRESPSHTIIPLLLDENVLVKAWDPIAINNFQKVHPELEHDSNIEYYSSLTDCIKDTDACIILTEWNDVKNLSENEYIKLMHQPVIIDGRNCYPIDRFQSHNVTYLSIGRPQKSVSRSDMYDSI